MEGFIPSAGEYLITSQTAMAHEGRSVCSEEAGTYYRQDRAVEKDFGELTPAVCVNEAFAGVQAGASSPR